MVTFASVTSNHVYVLVYAKRMCQDICMTSAAGGTDAAASI